LPEVADAAAVFFDPASCEDMVRAMRDILREDELRARLKRLGLQRAAQFSWRRTAERTLAVYHAVCNAEFRPCREDVALAPLRRRP
jgi:glycosyltransferase involved in cell wall biosynthesis